MHLEDFHAFWKVLEVILDFPGFEKSCQLKVKSWNVLKNDNPG